MKRKYEEDHSAVGMERCERLVMMILKIFAIGGKNVEKFLRRRKNCQVSEWRVRATFHR